MICRAVSRPLCGAPAAEAANHERIDRVRDGLSHLEHVLAVDGVRPRRRGGPEFAPIEKGAPGNECDTRRPFAAAARSGPSDGDARLVRRASRSKGLQTRAFRSKRMKGLEPSTFCMASGATAQGARRRSTRTGCKRATVGGHCRLTSPPLLKQHRRRLGQDRAAVLVVRRGRGTSRRASMRISCSAWRGRTEGTSC